MALQRALVGLQRQQQHDLRQLWARKLLFAVGAKTARRLIDLLADPCPRGDGSNSSSSSLSSDGTSSGISGSRIGGSDHAPCVVQGGAACGSAEALADLVCGTYADQPGQLRPLLFPCARQRLDTIPARLAQAGVPLVELVCYETVAEGIGAEVVHTLQDARYDWIVFFSPLGVRAVLGDADLLPQLLEHWPAHTAAIGPTTAQALLTAVAGLGGSASTTLLQADFSAKIATVAVAAVPTPEGLCSAIISS
jgi:uroporphyrinogen-III synthase